VEVNRDPVRGNVTWARRQLSTEALEVGIAKGVCANVVTMHHESSWRSSLRGPIAGRGNGLCPGGLEGAACALHARMWHRSRVTRGPRCGLGRADEGDDVGRVEREGVRAAEAQALKEGDVLRVGDLHVARLPEHVRLQGVNGR